MAGRGRTVSSPGSASPQSTPSTAPRPRSPASAPAQRPPGPRPREADPGPRRGGSGWRRLTHMLLKRNRSSQVKARSVVIAPQPASKPAQRDPAPALPEVLARAAAMGRDKELLPDQRLLGNKSSDAALSGGGIQQLPWCSSPADLFQKTDRMICQQRGKTWGQETKS